MRKIVLTFGIIAGFITIAMFFITNPVNSEGDFRGGEATWLCHDGNCLINDLFWYQDVS